MDKKIEVAIERILGDLQDRGVKLEQIKNISLSTQVLVEGLLVMVIVEITGQDHDRIEYTFLVMEE